jgi:hypothetical protein
MQLPYWPDFDFPPPHPPDRGHFASQYPPTLNFEGGRASKTPPLSEGEGVQKRNRKGEQLANIENFERIQFNVQDSSCRTPPQTYKTEYRSFYSIEPMSATCFASRASAE